MYSSTRTGFIGAIDPNPIASKLFNKFPRQLNVKESSGKRRWYESNDSEAALVQLLAASASQLLTLNACVSVRRCNAHYGHAGVGMCRCKALQ